MPATANATRVDVGSLNFRMNAVNAADDSGDDAPPAVPPKSPRPLLQYSTSVSVRQRAQTFTASSAGTTGQTAPLRYSPSTSRTQPAGTAARARESQLLLQRTASTSARSSPVAVVASTSNRASQGKRRREVVFCDVVVDELELGAEGEVVWPLGESLARCRRRFELTSCGTASADFLNSQERVQVADEHALLLPRSRSATPRSVPTGRVDSAAVRRSLKELWQTEDSYLRKIQSLYNVSNATDCSKSSVDKLILLTARRILHGRSGHSRASRPQRSSLRMPPLTCSSTLRSSFPYQSPSNVTCAKSPTLSTRRAMVCRLASAR